MQKIKIKSDIKDNDFFSNNLLLLELYYDLEVKNFKFYLDLILLFCFSIFIIYSKYKYRNLIELKPFYKYVRDCKKSIFYNITKVYNKTPYVAICISALNMEKYIKKNLLSIINQSFQDFEIIIVNDKSTDETYNIIKNLQLYDDRIKLISHTKNLGVYHSRIESILNAKSNFILLMDPDDMYMNKNLLLELYNHNQKHNFDIIEFSVFQQFDEHNKIFYPDNHFETHFHKFSKEIIYQPELSEILFYFPGTSNYSHTICRNIWNKIIRKDIFLKTYKYIGIQYFNDYIITADDMIMNIISYQFANNYTNCFLPGYLYIIRSVSMSRGNGGNILKQTRAINHLLYFKIFYKYINDYNKNRNFLYYEMRNLNRFLMSIKECDNKSIKMQIDFIETIMKDELISSEFKNYLHLLLIYIKS